MKLHHIRVQGLGSYREFLFFGTISFPVFVLQTRWFALRGEKKSVFHWKSLDLFLFCLGNNLDCWAAIPKLGLFPIIWNYKHSMQ